VNPDQIICDSAYTAASVQRSFETPAPAVIHCPIERSLPERSRKLVRATLGVADDTLLILMVSRLEEGKGHKILLESLASLRALQWRLAVVGGAQGAQEVKYLEAMKNLAQRFGIAERVDFLGSRSDSSDLLGAADIFCHPHTAPESFGIAIVEAMAAGVPVIASAKGGPIETVGDSGVLVPAGDVESLTGALSRLMSSPKLRSQLALSAQNRARAFCDPQRTLDELYIALRGSPITVVSGTREQ
jgi:glycosyltransferase involved in cell wall biosynthesis